MKYFKLHVYCKYVSGEKFGCIYNMNTHEMIKIEPPLKNIIESAQQNKCLSIEEQNVLVELVEKGIGTFYDKPNFIESLHFGPNPAIKTMVQPNLRINRCFIQVSNDCDLNCCFCNENNIVNRRTCCKKWNNKAQKITVQNWNSILLQLKKLGCEEICFIGGNPFLNFKKMFDIASLANEMGITKFSVYSHQTNIDNEIIGFLHELHFTFIGTILSLQETNYKKITGLNMRANIIDEIKKLKKHQIDYIANVVIGDFNEDEIEDIIMQLKENQISYRLCFIYDKPNIKYSSDKYKEIMYEKKYDFSCITKESLSFLEEYNSCLFGQISINLAGDITPCPMMNSYIIGNICIDQNIAHIIRSDTYRNLIQLNRSNIDGCEKCAYRFGCLDCRAIEYMATNKIDGQKFCKYKEDNVGQE